MASSAARTPWSTAIDTSFFVAACATVGPAASSRAKAIVTVLSRSSATTRLTIPQRSIVRAS